MTGQQVADKTGLTRKIHVIGATGDAGGHHRLTMQSIRPHG